MENASRYLSFVNASLHSPQNPSSLNILAGDHSLGLSLFQDAFAVRIGSQSYRQVHMTMINFKRTGGSMGREMEMSFDFDSMPGSIAMRLQGLLTDSNFFDVPVVNDLRTGPDEYRYDITVVSGNSIHTIHVSDTSMPQSVRPLVEELTELTETAA